jgi:hypothetical protein
MTAASVGTARPAPRFVLRTFWLLHVRDGLIEEGTPLASAA